jgi:hypothetical protein
MPDILYPIAICKPIVVLIKNSYCQVAFNESGIELESMIALNEIGYVTHDNINIIKTVKILSDKSKYPKIRDSENRNLREVQDSQLALELMRYINKAEHLFVIEELLPVLFPIKLLSEVLSKRAEYEMPDIDLVQIAAGLIYHSDWLIRQNLKRSEIQLPNLKLSISDSSPNPSVPATELVLTYFEQTLNDFSQVLTEKVSWRVDKLLTV